MADDNSEISHTNTLLEKLLEKLDRLSSERQEDKNRINDL